MQIAVLLLPMLLLQSGGKLEIKDTKVGKGPAAVDLDLLTMDYTGKLADGTVFDSSTRPGAKPFQFVLGAKQVIKGWDQGVKGMKIGGKRTLVIPPELGYGARGAGNGVIPPNATLTFDIELKGIHKCDYKILKKGSGEGAKGGDSVEVHYTGMFTNGKKFDSSLDRGAPMPVTIGRTRLVNGFTQALCGMKLGEKRKVTIPPEFGYGSQARDPIPANSTLVFEIEMVKFLK